ncbi:hypothetical protein E1B28_008400 [Marasmius oreades]|uniref:Uncharacterized protein n=1 Tax=Marasmius oreades TaxID=181124 RepID=A0A9P7RZ06_9AGAR|nr:uncharacterized protein E1B28_008400 [Marasmius oreades]KAG7092017.1 hypothetical protein E1B28_008400 [Marasmius oreades]
MFKYFYNYETSADFAQNFDWMQAQHNSDWNQHDVVDKSQRLAILIDNYDVPFWVATRSESDDYYFAVTDTIGAFFSAIEVCSQTERIGLVLLAGETFILDHMPPRPDQLP